MSTDSIIECSSMAGQCLSSDARIAYSDCPRRLRKLADLSKRRELRRESRAA
jgi:hypothetical protein